MSLWISGNEGVGVNGVCVCVCGGGGGATFKSDPAATHDSVGVSGWVVCVCVCGGGGGVTKFYQYVSFSIQFNFFSTQTIILLYGAWGSKTIQ